MLIYRAKDSDWNWFKRGLGVILKSTLQAVPTKTSAAFLSHVANFDCLEFDSSGSEIGCWKVVLGSSMIRRQSGSTKLR